MAELLVFLLYVSALFALGLGIAAWVPPRRSYFVWPALAWPVMFLLVFRFSVVARLRGGAGMDYEYEWILMPAMVFALPATVIAGAIGAALLSWRGRVAAFVLLMSAVLTVVTDL